MRSTLLFIATPAALLLTGCLNDTTVPLPHVPCSPLLETFFEAPTDTVKTMEGIRYIDFEVGTGTPAGIGTVVDVNYSGYLLDGTPFESSCPEERSVFRLAVGGSQSIPGFWMGIIGMRQDGVRRVIIPPEFAYGDNPPGSGVPPNATLVFDIQLVRRF